MSSSVAVEARTIRASRDSILTRLEALAPVLLVLGILLWIAVIFVASVYKYETFGQGYDQVDFEKGRWQWFASLTLLAMLARTDVALVVAMFGVYALLTRRKWPYVVGPLLVGFGYFVLSTFLIVPSYAYPGALSGGSSGSLGSNYMDCWPCGTNPIIAYYGHLGSSGPEIIKYIVTHPIEVAGLMFTGAKMIYMLSLLLPL